MSKDHNLPPTEYVEALKRKGFTIERRLGRGAFGTVYLASQDKLNRSVAIKFFKVDGIRIMPDDKQRFVREAQLLAKVEHPAIPYVLTTGSVTTSGGDVPYLVMQLVPGSGLDVVIRQERRLPLARAAAIVREILDALGNVHNQHVLHRDIKPDNILTDGRRTWLVDFSLGASVVYEPGLSRSTAPGRGLGVPEYASPEQQTDAKSCDLRTDLFACGVVLFELLAGHPRLDRQQLASQLRDVPPEAIDVIRKATSPDRADRFASAEDFRVALQPFVVGIPTIEAPSLALCSDPKCSAAKRSVSGYFFAPRIETTASRFCDGCGKPLLRKCNTCSAPLSAQAPERVGKASKRERDGGNLYCAECGNLIFEYPLCRKCGSLLKIEDIGRDTASLGCQKCQRRAPEAEVHVSPSDDDIPF